MINAYKSLLSILKYTLVLRTAKIQWYRACLTKDYNLSEKTVDEMRLPELDPVIQISANYVPFLIVVT